MTSIFGPELNESTNKEVYRMDEWMNGRKEGPMNDGFIYEWMNGQMDG